MRHSSPVFWTYQWKIKSSRNPHRPAASASATPLPQLVPSPTKKSTGGTGPLRNHISAKAEAAGDQSGTRDFGWYCSLFGIFGGYPTHAFSGQVDLQCHRSKSAVSSVDAGIWSLQTQKSSPITGFVQKGFHPKMVISPATMLDSRITVLLQFISGQ